MEAGQLSKLVEISTGQLWILVRDDTKETGFVYAAPANAMTSMMPFTPEKFTETFTWYVDPKDRPIDVQAVVEVEPPKKRVGRPKGAKDKVKRKRPDIAVPKDWKPDPAEVAIAEGMPAPEVSGD